MEVSEIFLPQIETGFTEINDCLPKKLCHFLGAFVTGFTNHIYSFNKSFLI